MTVKEGQPRGPRVLTREQIAQDLSVSTRHVDRLNIPGKTYALGERCPRWWADQYEAWKENLRNSREAAA